MKKSYIFIALTAFIFCTFFIISCEKNIDPDLVHPNDVPGQEIGDDWSLPYTNPDWMADISDDTYLSQISIPGTHDSGADLHTSAQGVESYITICQHFRLSNQLLLGVRWFDIRLRDDMCVFHWKYYLHKNFDDLLIQVQAFLQAHPTEVVIFKIKQENSSTDDYTFARTVHDKLMQYPGLHLYLDAHMPRLGAVRGKLIIMRHDIFSDGGNAMGALLTWPDNTSLYFRQDDFLRYYVQDHYKLSGVNWETKRYEIENLICTSVNYPDLNRFDFNFTSGEANASCISLIDIANYFNYQIKEFLHSWPDIRHCGVIILNFAGGTDDGNRGCTPELVQAIIEHNDFIEIETVTIGSQVWMKKNLNVTYYRNGDPIPNVTDPTAWSNLTTGAYCNYDNDESHSVSDGKLYNWYAVNDPRGLAPRGWHVPSDAEWTTLVNYLGGENVAGGKLKATIHWNYPNTGATNESGFTAYPGGYRNNLNGNFMEVGLYGYWRSPTGGNPNQDYVRKMSYNSTQVNRILVANTNGHSVRCVKD